MIFFTIIIFMNESNVGIIFFRYSELILFRYLQRSVYITPSIMLLCYRQPQWRGIANGVFCYAISAVVVRIYVIIQPVDRNYKRIVYDYMYTFKEFAVVIASAVGRHCFLRVCICTYIHLYTMLLERRSGNVPRYGDR